MIEYFTTSSVDDDLIGSWLRSGFDIYNKTKKTIYNNAKKLIYAPYKIGDRIGQMVFVNYPHVKLIQREELTETTRGANGFGSTGN